MSRSYTSTSFHIFLFTKTAQHGIFWVVQVSVVGHGKQQLIQPGD